MSARLGEILIKEKLISQEQLTQALDHQKKNGGRLGAALVMGGAIAVGVFAFARAKGLRESLLGAPMHRADGHRIDRRLVFGSLAFGIGWGLGGFCPGPAIVWLGTGDGKTALFVLAMAGGMALYELSQKRAASKD